MPEMELAYDIKMYAVVRIKVDAKDLKQAKKLARNHLDSALDCMDLSDATIAGINDGLGIKEVKITEASLHQDDEGGPYLFEVDGEDVG